MNTKNNPPSLPVLLDSKTVAGWLGISRERLYSLVLTAQFPCVRISKRRLRFDPAELKKWLKQRGWKGAE